MANEAFTPPTPTPPGTTIPMFSPTGRVGDVPVEQVDAATKAGFKRGVDMVSPTTGKVGTIPIDQAEAAQKEKYRLATAEDLAKSQSKAFNAMEAAGTGISEETSEAMRPSHQKAAAIGAGMAAGGLAGPAVGAALEGAGLAAAPEAGLLTQTGIGAARGAIEGGTAGAVGGAVTGAPGGLKTAAKEAAGGAVGGAVTGAALGAAVPVVKTAIQGKTAAQAPAQTAVREAAGQAGTSVGAQPAVKGQGIRTLLDNPIATLAKTERATYDALNKAADADLKDLYETRDALNDALNDPSNFTNDELLQGRLRDTEARVQTAEENARRNGVPPETLQKATALTKQRYAFQELKKKLFNNESVVSGNALYGRDETLNVDQALKVTENLNKPSRYAPEGTPTRLQQALGTQGANQLLQDLYDAQAAGEKAVGIQKWAKWIAGAVALAGAAEAGRLTIHAMSSEKKE